MSFILKSVTVLDPAVAHHDQCVDIHIEDGIIAGIAPSIKNENCRIIDFSEKNCLVSPGWFDLAVHFNDPGHEYKEGLQSGQQLLSAGGFTGAGVLPNTSPVIQHKTDIAYILRTRESSFPVALYPYGAVTRECAGEELTEMIDMHHAGSIAFTDGLNAIDNADIVLKALLYLQKFGGVLLQRPEDRRLNLFGSMHEGQESTMLGLKGMPALAETLMIQRDLSILAYTGGRLHFTALSTAAAVGMVAEAKAKGLSVTCDVALHQLLLTDEAVGLYDTNSKVNPPLRTEEDRQALIEGVRSGVIDVITTHHQPQDEESKKMEFDLAEFGMIGIQTFFPLLQRLSSDIPMTTLMRCITENPRKVLGLRQPTVEIGQPAELTCFTTDQQWPYELSNNQSRSANSPFLGEQMSGKVYGTINGSKLYLNS
ncbi:MAG: dihydroorotase [Bacteroidota bacterium]